jgi:signal transduction histidine kinase
MNPKHLYFMGKLKPGKIPVYTQNGNLRLVDRSNVSTYKNETTENQLLERLHEMEVNHIQLEKLFEEQTSKLSDVNETNAKFLSILAHDLRSPFQSIISVLDLLQDSFEEYDKKEVETYINIATNSANTTLRLLDNLLSWASSQNKQKSFNPAKANLCHLVTLEIESVNALAAQKLITFNNLIASNLFVTADLQMVNTILRNLICNAIKYSYTGGEITISAIERKQFVEIEIKDNGVGMSQSAQKELFKKNEFHSTRGTKSEYGTGLGLLLCKEFVEMHGGIIWIESETGKGSKILFTLPHYI